MAALEKTTAEQLADAIRALEVASEARHRAMPGTSDYEAAQTEEDRLNAVVLDLARGREDIKLE